VQFYVFKNNQQVGPFPLMDVRARLQSGEFSYDDLAWREGLADWTPLKDLMGGALPDATPHSVSPTSSAYATAPAKAPTGLRLLTAFAIFVILFIGLFVFTYLLVCVIGGFWAGFQAGLSRPPNPTDAGRQAGGDFVRNNLALITGGSALFSLLVSALVSWLMAFSSLLPWCRPR
jgi:hypothetical protein